MDIDLIQMHLRTARCKLIPDWHDRHGWPEVHKTVASGNPAEVNRLLERDKSLVNASSRDGWTPLHVAVGLSGANKDNENKILKALLGADADPNARNKDGLTPLHVAAALHHDHAVEVVKSLSAGTDFFPDARDCKGRTALHIAAAKNKCREVVSLLLCEKRVLCERRVLNAQDRAGNTPLHKAAAKTKNPEIVKLLLDKGADQWLKNGRDNCPSISPNRTRNSRAPKSTGGSMKRRTPLGPASAAAGHRLAARHLVELTALSAACVRQRAPRYCRSPCRSWHRVAAHRSGGSHQTRRLLGVRADRRCLVKLGPAGAAADQRLAATPRTPRAGCRAELTALFRRPRPPTRAASLPITCRSWRRAVG